MTDDEMTAVRQAANGFYAALNALFTGDMGPMEDVWSHSADVTYMGPGGDFRVGWDQVRESWEAQAAMKLGGRVEPADVQITLGGEIAATHNVEVGENTPADGRRQSVSIRATNLFRKEKGTWKMIGHHADPLPYVAT